MLRQEKKEASASNVNHGIVVSISDVPPSLTSAGIQDLFYSCFLLEEPRRIRNPRKSSIWDWCTVGLVEPQDTIGKLFFKSDRGFCWRSL